MKPQASKKAARSAPKQTIRKPQSNKPKKGQTVLHANSKRQEVTLLSAKPASSRRNKKAQFKQSKNAQGPLSFDKVTHVGWIYDPLILGRLTKITEGEGRVVFEFKLNGKKFDAWSAKTNDSAKENKQLFKIGYKYVIQGQMRADGLSKQKYDRASNATFAFKLHLIKISVVKEEVDNVTAVYANAQISCSFKKMNQLIKSGKSFTNDATNITILSGELRRYIGCSKCYSGISKPTNRTKFFCKQCKEEPIRTICLIIRNLKLKDSDNGILENVVCFHGECNRLFGKKVVENLCLPSYSDLRARDEFDSLIGTIITATIKHQLPTGSQQTSFNVSKVVITNLRDIKYSRQPKIQLCQQSAQKQPNSTEALCLCEDDASDDDEEIGDSDSGNENDNQDTLNYLPRNNGRRELLDSHYQLEPTSEGWTGMCMIINMTKGRKGSRNDVRRLKKIFPQLGVQIFNGGELENINKDQFYAQVEAFKRQLIRGRFSSLFFVFMSHGSLYNVRLNDNSKLCVYSHILPLFGERHFPEFIGKPKIFVFQACQNLPIFQDLESAKDFSYQFVVDDTDRIYDTLDCYPCSPGVKAKRCTVNGSYFIQTLVDVFEECWKEFDIENMLKKVQDRMKNERLGNDENSINIPEYKPKVFNKFYFYGRQLAQEVTTIDYMDTTDD